MAIVHTRGLPKFGIRTRTRKLKVAIGKVHSPPRVIIRSRFKSAILLREISESTLDKRITYVGKSGH